MKFSHLFFAVALISHCQARPNVSETSAATKTVEGITYLFELGREEPRLLFRSTCRGESPYTLAKCSNDKQAREWNPLKEKVDGELKGEIDVLENEIVYLQSTQLSKDKLPTEQKLLIDELLRKKDEKEILEGEREKLLVIERTFSIPASSAVLSLDERGKVGILKSIVSKLFSSTVPSDKLIDGRAFTRFLKYFENTGFLADERIDLRLLTLYRGVKIDISKKLGSIYAGDLKGKKLFLESGTFNAKDIYPNTPTVKILINFGEGYFEVFRPGTIYFNFYPVRPDNSKEVLKNIFMAAGSATMQLSFDESMAIRTLKDLKLALGNNFEVIVVDLNAMRK